VPKFVSAKDLKNQKKECELDNFTEVVEKLLRIESLLAEIFEKLESIEDTLQSLRQQAKNDEGRSRSRVRKVKVVVKNEGEKRSALDIIKEQGVVFESDLKNIANRDRFFAHLAKHGVKVITGLRERVAVTEEFLESFMKELEKLRGPAEAEEKLKDRYRRFYEFLRESGLLLYDSKKGWILTLEKNVNR